MGRNLGFLKTPTEIGGTGEGDGLKKVEMSWTYWWGKHFSSTAIEIIQPRKVGFVWFLPRHCVAWIQNRVDILSMVSPHAVLPSLGI